MIVVEKDHEQPVVFAGRFALLIVERQDLALRDRIVHAIVDLHELERLNGLEFAALTHLEVARREVGDRAALLVGDDRVHGDRIDAGTKHGGVGGDAAAAASAGVWRAPTPAVRTAATARTAETRRRNRRIMGLSLSRREAWRDQAGRNSQ